MVNPRPFMVVYDLLCQKNHRFEGWFPSFEEFQKQASRGQVSCPTCGSSKVEKMPHACAVLTHRSDPQQKKESPPQEKASPSTLTEADAKELLLRLHRYVKENFEDVGPRFAAYFSRRQRKKTHSRDLDAGRKRRTRRRRHSLYDPAQARAG
ncbi:MAG: DUF1178 family protein [Deltaproteobacteria bacterium]|nr:MAG: DUF1178 family protein [Deltaproteobacteria bacterium]